MLIPCYNEAVTIGKVVDDFRRVMPDADIYVYDNNSKDETSKIAAEHGAIVRFEGRQGKGNGCGLLRRAIFDAHAATPMRHPCDSSATLSHGCRIICGRQLGIGAE